MSAPFSETYTRLIVEFERWTEAAKYRSDADVRPLVQAAAAHMRTLRKRFVLAEVGPTFAVLYFAAEEFDYAWWKRIPTRLYIWAVRRLWLSGRPLWNDFYMGLWMLSRDPRYVARLHSHLKRANAIQLETGHWMITSVCQQDEVFREHWTDIVAGRGDVFA